MLNKQIDMKNTIQNIQFEQIKIGDQIWMLKNLKLNQFRNGDLIPLARTNEQWKQAGMQKKTAYCYYDDKEENIEKYGLLYNYYAVTDDRGLAPLGWRIPNQEDWRIMTATLGGPIEAISVLKSRKGWEKNFFYGKELNGNNNSGFTGLPGGFRDSEGYYNLNDFNKYSFWWSLTDNIISAYNKNIDLNSKAIASCLGNLSFNIESISSKSCGYSVRCIMDNY